MGKQCKQCQQCQTLFFGAPRSLQMVIAAMKLKTTTTTILVPGRKPRQHIKKQRHYFANKICLVKTMVFPVVMCGCESWTIKKAECQRIDAFELWCWRRLLRVPWTARRSNQSSWSWNSSTLAPWCEELKRPWCWERLKAGGEGDGREWDGWMASATRYTQVWASCGHW